MERKGLVIGLVFSAFLFCLASWVHAEEQLVDRVVAVVNQEVITQSELDEIFFPIHQQLSETYQGEELARRLQDARNKILSQLIEDKLVRQEAAKLNIEVTDQEVEERLLEFKKQFPPDRDFDEMLRAQNLDLKTIKDKIRDQVTIQKLHYVQIQRNTAVSPLEEKEFYDRHPEQFVEKEKIKLWAITIPKSQEAALKGTMDEGAKKKAESILRELKKGKDFSELAMQESKDAHAKEGGLIGYVARGDMIGKIDDILFQLKENEISSLVETERSYHIFKVGDKQPGKTLSFEEARERIHEMLYREKSNARFEEWMEELKKKAYISIR